MFLTPSARRQNRPQDRAPEGSVLIPRCAWRARQTGAPEADGKPRLNAAGARRSGRFGEKNLQL
jgi:hypothetical protein